MEGRQKPDAQSDSAIDLNDDEIIDLTQVVQKGANDEIIDLTNVLDQPEVEPEVLEEAADPSSKADETIIDLTEPAEADEETVPPLDKEDDDFIDLVEMEKTLDAEMTETALKGTEAGEDFVDAGEPEAGWAQADDTEEIEDLDLEADVSAMDLEEDQDLAFADEDADDEEIIDLTNVEDTLDTDQVEPVLEKDKDFKDAFQADESEALVTETDETEEIADLNLQADVSAMDLADGQDLTFADETADDQEIIDLTEMEKALDEDLADNLTGDKEDNEEVIDLLETVQPVNPPADVPQAGVVEGGAPPAAPAEPFSAKALSLTEQQLEEALERTIRRIYAEKIEQLMIQTIEKTVQREIEKIKHAIMESDDDASD